MTTITLARTATDADACTWSVCVNYHGRQGQLADGSPRVESFNFGMRHFDDLATAERYARRLMKQHQADHFQRCC